MDTTLVTDIINALETNETNGVTAPILERSMEQLVAFEEALKEIKKIARMSGGVQANEFYAILAEKALGENK